MSPNRLSAGNYTLAMSLIVVVWSLLTTFVCSHHLQLNIHDAATLTQVIGALGALVGLLFFPLSVGRLKDLNFPSWTIHILSIPLTGVILLPLLCFMSGARWENDYGDPPDRSSALKRFLALASFAAAVFLFKPAVTVFYQTRYALAS
jgi:uncharacterized membrane protein YhaH (DUF805 family)